MNTTSEAYGIMRFQPFENFLNPLRGMSHESKIDAMVNQIIDGTQDSAADWTGISRALRRNNLFVLEASTHVWKALLRFDPLNPNTGDYSISRLRSAQPELGSIERVKPISADILKSHASRVARYPTTFQIVTSSRFGGYRNVWFVGLSRYEQADDLDDSSPPKAIETMPN